MSSRQDRQTRIQEVRELSCAPEMAYAARTRLQRAILTWTRWVAKEAGLVKPLFPGRYEVPHDSPEHVRKICEITNSLVERTKSIGQPSEPLDERWTDGWSEILLHLDQLEGMLQTGASTAP